MDSQSEFQFVINKYRKFYKWKFSIYSKQKWCIWKDDTLKKNIKDFNQMILISHNY